MSWDQPVHSFSYPHGEPQTPTRTPMTSAFDSFTTPKLESSFFDPRVTWDTADPYASSPEFLRSPHKFGISTPNVATAEVPPETRDRRDSANTDTVRRIRSTKQPVPSEEGPRTVDSNKPATSIQTPPPSSASRRKIPEFEPAESAGKGTTPRMNNHLETPSRLLGMSPRLFGNLQASPDLFQLASMEASRSPFLPQQRLFWDAEPVPPVHGLPTSEPARSNNRPERETARPSTQAVIPQLPAIDGYMDLPDFTSSGMGLLSAPTTDAAVFPAPFSTSPRIPVTKAEDPAMFLSSPARRFGGPGMTPDRRPAARQPYHHQVEESKREELRRVLSSGGHRPGSWSSFSDEDEDDDYTPRGRPGLTRSVTHSAIALSTHRPPSRSSGMMASTSGIRKSPTKGRISPVKTMRPVPLGRSCSMAARMPTRSQSVVLKIGKDGRAKAEMQLVDEGPTGLTDPLTGMDLEESLVESELDSAEYSDYPVLSRPQSFSFSLLDGGRSVMSQSDSSSRPPSKGSYSSTVGSSQSGRVSPWAGSSRAVSSRSTYRGSPEAVKRTPSKRHSSLFFSDASYTRGSVASQALPGEEEEAEDDEDDGDATHALRQVLKERARAPRPSMSAGFGARLPRANTFTHLRSSPPRLHSDFDIHHSHHSHNSPNTISDPDVGTPHIDRHCHSNPSNGTRCVCNSMDNGGHLMIQCESCTHWLHTKCVGLERSNLPSFYVCMFCSQTPSRIRSGYAPGGGPPSPLAHKSFRTR
ncbi:hypothetical protein PDE_00067 [Penicillium oxalicum 114-2]|uniref:PHD-type domain-containing protein n=1 Tax=Penicillium oxalicum (strain 114-2 / CGMCC 5302) TaxID=933388 RepID=S7Z8Y9_PENO1|nr:hypothetical protein PDE_00067 [Penicillium oxalicum 114-2]